MHCAQGVHIWVHNSHQCACVLPSVASRQPAPVPNGPATTAQLSTLKGSAAFSDPFRLGLNESVDVHFRCIQRSTDPGPCPHMVRDRLAKLQPSMSATSTQSETRILDSGSHVQDTPSGPRIVVENSKSRSTCPNSVAGLGISQKKAECGHLKSHTQQPSTAGPRHPSMFNHSHSCLPTFDTSKCHALQGSQAHSPCGCVPTRRYERHTRCRVRPVHCLDCSAVFRTEHCLARHKRKKPLCFLVSI
ncbi:hypothetical protein BJ741DRAFT_607898 [Chytriomyces cf. hyalinus JEL632]|nr:hypothetical protein BJ741DRAFT_607898 [Chytriomyces cf. hyalinus JEL632]